VINEADDTGARFAANFRAARERAELSGTQVAEQMRERGHRYYQQTVSRIESGGQPPKLVEAAALADIVGTSVDALIRPPELGRLAADILSGARRVRESRRALAGATRRYEVDAENLRGFLEEARAKGKAEALRDEIRAGMSALGDPSSRPSAPGRSDGPQSGEGTAHDTT
jgi:transcriptional regulator with XRE-family HTH domain